MAKTIKPPAGSTDPTKEGEGALVRAPMQALSAPGSAPAWLQAKMEAQKGARGLENVEREDIIYPRLVLCQKATPAVESGDAEIGDIIDNLTGDVLSGVGSTLRFIPVVYSVSRMFMKSLDDGGGIECRSDNGKESQPNGKGQDQGGKPTRDCTACVHKEWDDSNGEHNAPACTKFMNIIGFLPDHGNRVVAWSGKSTNIKVFRRLLSVVKQTGFDFWAHCFELFTVDGASGKFTFKNWDFQSAQSADGSPNPWASEAEYKRGEELYKALAETKWAVAHDSEESDTSFPDAPAEVYESAKDKAAEPAPKAEKEAPKAVEAKATKKVENKPVSGNDDVAF